MKWEYKFIRRERSISQTATDHMVSDLELLNREGQEGWELVLIGGDNTNVFLFKRLKQ